MFSEPCFESACSLDELPITELSPLVSVCRIRALCKYLQQTYGQVSLFCKVEQKAKVVPVHLVPI